MANGKKPVLTGVIQNPETKKILGRVALWNYEGKKKEEVEGESSPFSKKLVKGF